MLLTQYGAGCKATIPFLLWRRISWNSSGRSLCSVLNSKLCCLCSQICTVPLIAFNISRVISFKKKVHTPPQLVWLKGIGGSELEFRDKSLIFSCLFGGNESFSDMGKESLGGQLSQRPQQGEGWSVEDRCIAHRPS